MGKHGTETERERPVFEGQSAEEFIKRWNAITKAIKMARRNDNSFFLVRNAS